MRVGLAPPLIAVVVLDFSRQDRSSGAGDAAPPTASDLLPPSVVATAGEEMNFIKISSPAAHCGLPKSDESRLTGADTDVRVLTAF